MFTPHTSAETEEMLKKIGVRSINDLFLDVPEKFRFPKLELAKGLTEMEALQELREFSSSNETVDELLCFLGAGAYHHYIPAAIDSLLRRGEFYTAYTPYQPEISQGTLQAIFEFQSLISNLTGMEVSNASHYDGATACAEAGLMAWHHFRGTRKKLVLSPTINPQYVEVIQSYLRNYEGIQIISPPTDLLLKEGPSCLEKFIDRETALVMVQYPDFLGRLYDYSFLAKKVHEDGGLLAVATNPTALGLIKPPGEMGADIVVGEGQSLGIPLSYGGPYLGFLSTKKDFVRKISGRLAGETIDAQGRRGYVLTLTAREQHIRREKASSNICTNQGLMALAATIYLSLLGKSGLKQVAQLCYQKAHYAADTLNHLKGFQVLLDVPFFHEFILKCPTAVEEVNEYLLDHDILGGLDLGKVDPALSNHMLLCVTELNSKDQIDHLASILGEISHD